MIKSFDELNITQLRSIVRKYNLHTKIVKYTKMDKPKLIEALSGHIHINEKGKISIKENVAGNKALTDLLAEIHSKMERLHQRLQRKRPRVPVPAPAPKPKPKPKPVKQTKDYETSDYESESDTDTSSDDDMPITKQPARVQYEGAPLVYIHKNEIKDINSNIDVILADLPKDKSKKAYMITTYQNDLPDNKIAKAIWNLIPIYRRFNTGSQITALRHLWNQKDYYLGITFYKDGDKLKVTAGALIEKVSRKIKERRVNRLHINLLEGVGGAGLILDLIRKIAEKKVKHPWLKKINFDFMDLDAVASGNTLDFYDYKGGKVDDDTIESFREEAKDGIGALSEEALREYMIIKKMPHKTEEQMKEKNKFIYKFWDKHIRRQFGLIPYFFFYDTNASQKDKKDLSKGWYKTQPKELLKEEMNNEWDI